MRHALRLDGLRLNSVRTWILMLTALGAVSFAAPFAQGGEWGPWSVSPAAPVFSQPRQARPQQDAPQSRLVDVPFLGLLKFYQVFISPMDGDRCPLHPTCSQFSIQAIRRHGPAVGVVMTADRLMHEADESRLSQKVMVGSRIRGVDTLDDNDFWWYRHD